ncbi:MAG: CusA/CzcA family heavy metal efflux RND transporter [Gemmatimonadetes bacterium]|nr:CusA/CzcA family heavy metal efflux RND transporter [Gemmatimonadota bacterium]MDP7362146.1 efflux RND transporter permease subunit [Candidatus Latescibacterota bacterium]MDP7633503.1 efflux RND transporter permease subunit [Candidatus Latescibacterota bacterium]HCV22802.1 CusA/CzcA family heavy metal efflux RND transporter [Candidatus Latescibacterota bacterium]
MLHRIIEVCINNRFLTMLATVFIVGAGLWAVRKTPLDAIPDLSDVQVIILTDYPGQAPQVVEDQVTYPLSTAMLSVPHASVVRGYSFFGLSFVYVLFEDGTDIYWARSRVLEYLNVVADRLPAAIQPRLGPDATGVGWVYQYVLEDTSGTHDLAQLRSLQDWYLRYELTSVPGVAEVASIGGFVKQYQVTVDPNRLLAYGVPLQRVRTAIQRSNNDVGGRLVELSEREFMVRGPGYISSTQDIEAIAVGVDTQGTPVRVGDVATVQVGPELRRGLAEWNGTGETVGGIVVMRYGENALGVIERVTKRLEELKDGLPQGVAVHTAYDRSGLILRAVDNLQVKLIEECAIVALVCLLFLLHVRSAFVAIVTLPLGILISFVVMHFQGINANIMSLGGIAIAIGVMVDAAVVMVENTHKHIERDGGKKEHWAIVLDAAKEVGPSLFYSLLIVTLSFLPVFTLQAQEGRLFKPLAFTKTWAMAAAALLAITIVPVLMGYLVRGRILPETRNPINRFLLWCYRPVITWVLRNKAVVTGASLLILGATVMPYQSWVLDRVDGDWRRTLERFEILFPFERIGSEFMPPLYEGDLLYMPTTLPGVSITKARELLQQTDRIIRTFPEVDEVFGKIGRAETATDPAPLSMIETTITLKPESQWRDGMTPERLIEELDAAVKFPGLTNAWTMPIKTRLDMLSTGIKTPVGIKIAGEDLTVLQQIGEQIEDVIRRQAGTLSVYAERVVGGNYLDFDIDREAVARYGLTVGDVQDVIMSALGGMNITSTVEGRKRYPINLRYGRELRDNLPALKRVLISTPTGTQIPIGQIADLRLRKGPPAIKSENARLNAWVYVDIRGIDVGTYVEAARKAVAHEVELPAGYSLTWSGQYEYMQRAQQRLRLVVPVTLAVIFLLLYLNFRSVTESLIIMLSLPFALVGGIWLLAALDYNMSIAVGVGFIALAGVAAETGVIMLLYLDQAWNEARSKCSAEGRSLRRADLYAAVGAGAVDRVRPKVMTVTATMAGLLPIMWGTGTGSEVMHRIAAPMVGGLVSSTLLTLLVIPAIYTVWQGWVHRHDFGS